MMKEKRNYDLQERVIQFAVRVLDAVECLPDSRVGNHVSARRIRGHTTGTNYSASLTIDCGRADNLESVYPWTQS